MGARDLGTLLPKSSARRDPNPKLNLVVASPRTLKNRETSQALRDPSLIMKMMITKI